MATVLSERIESSFCLCWEWRLVHIAMATAQFYVDISLVPLPLSLQMGITYPEIDDASFEGALWTFTKWLTLKMGVR